MLQMRTRKEIGFTEDAFPGFIVFKDGNPVVQLHLYKEYYTVFWRGKVVLSQLHQYLSATINQISLMENIPLESLTNCIVQCISDDANAVSITFDISSHNYERGERHNKEYANLLSDLGYAKNAFFRFDTTGSMPVILWADTSGVEDSEIGFSSRILPPSVLELFRETCFANIDDEETEVISKEFRGLIRPHYELGG
jgi:hypothetical protein